MWHKGKQIPSTPHHFSHLFINTGEIMAIQAQGVAVLSPWSAMMKEIASPACGACDFFSFGMWQWLLLENLEAAL
jgi:hypothetical protein